MREMKLDDTQKHQVVQWIEQGLKLSEIQSRIAAEFKLALTYMDVRFLVDDLKLMPKDPEPPKVADLPPKPAADAPPATPPASGTEPQPAPPAPPAQPAAPGAARVSVVVDQIARPGAIVSGKVTFSDGQTAEWTLDQNGQLGLATQEKGYRPSRPDVQEFQQALQGELAKMGF